MTVVKVLKKHLDEAYDNFANMWEGFEITPYNILLDQPDQYQLRRLAYYVVGDKMKWWFKPLCEQLGYRYHETLVWCKPNLVGNSAGKISSDWNVMHEDILLFHIGKRTPMLKGSREMSTWNWFIETTPQTNFHENYRYHPAQFPNNMILRIIGRTPANLILDPFLGSGTTCFCAKKLNRYSIGIEIEEKYCEIAARRCSQEVMEYKPSDKKKLQEKLF